MFSHRIVCISKQNWNAPRVYWEVIIRLSHRLDAEILVMPPLKKEKIEGGKHLPQYQHIESVYIHEEIESWLLNLYFLRYSCQAAMKTKDAQLLRLAVIMAVKFGLWSSLFHIAYEVFVDQWGLSH